MSDQFVAEIRIFPFTFAPLGWAFCDGQLMPISQNTALFSLLGTVYGGNGLSNFALPNLQGNAPLHPGQGQGLSDRLLGEEGGVESVTLLTSEMPVHTHSLRADDADPAESNVGTNNVLSRSANGNAYTNDLSRLTQMAVQALPPAGGGLPHNNMQPYLTLNFCIALQGIFPPRG